MATAARGIRPPSAGDGVAPQAHPAVVSGSPISTAGDQKPHFVSPMGNIRQMPPHPGGALGAHVIRPPPLGSPPTTGPSPLFPPQAVAAVSLPRPQAGMPRFPFSGPPATTAGGVFPMPPPPNSHLAARPPGPPILPPPSSQPPPHTHPLQAPPPGAGVQRPPHNFPPPPGLPPPQARPPFSSPFPQLNPPISVAPQLLGGDPPNRPLGPSVLGTPPAGQPPPQFHPPRPPLGAGPPPPISGGQNLPPPRGPPPPMAPPPVIRSQLPPEQTPGLAMPPPIRFPPTSETGFSPHHAPSPTTPSTLSSPSTPSPGTLQHHQQAASSPKETAPLLPSPQQQAKSEAMMKGDAEKKDGGRELWFEHKLPDGRVYFSHPVTRKTTWDRPPNVQINPHPAQQSPPPTRSFPPPGPTPPGGMPNASHLVPTRVWSEFQTPEGKPYFYNKITRGSVWEKPTDFDLVMPLPPEIGAPPSGPPHQRMPLPHPAPSPGPRLPLIATPPMFRPPGRPPFNPGFPPGPPGHPAAAVMNQGLSPHIMEPRFPPPHTHLFSTPPPAGAVWPAGVEGGTAREPEEMEVENNSSAPSVGEATESGATVELETPGEGEETQEAGDATTSESSEAVQTEPEIEEPKGPRPTSSVPVPGTPWLVVWTSDKRQFFFDVTSRVSLWMVPEELKDNPLVEKIIEDGPDGQEKGGDAPSPKRVKLEDGAGDEDEEEIEGGGLDIAVGGEAVATMKMVAAETVDAEKTAAMIRSGKTLEERQEEFKEMLLERGVSAFSTWDKELPKFVFDPRYMLLSSKERKSCFEEFIRSRAEDERKEKRTKLKARRDEFRKLLEDSKLHPKSSFSEFALRHARDERFKAVEKMREREQLFAEYLQELKKTAAASGGRGRQRGGDRSATDHTASSAHPKPADKVKVDFMEMLSEDRSLSESSQWRKVKGGMERDPRYRAVLGGTTQREEWFKEYIRSLATATSSGSKVAGTAADPSREREERIQASMKEREREVQMSRSAQEKEWGRERDQLRRSEVLQQFSAMLADSIRTIGVSWNDARRQLRQDSRWASTGLLEAEEKEKLYQEHCDSLTEKKRLQFRRLLEETSQISLVMPWKKARKLVREDPRYKNFAESDHRREAEYDKHLRDRMVMAKNEFRSLLRETKLVTYKSHRLVRESERHYKEIVKVLENDQRYLVLECASEERDRILHDYMAELHRKGPPPPPTASNPSERLRKP